MHQRLAASLRCVITESSIQKSSLTVGGKTGRGNQKFQSLRKSDNQSIRSVTSSGGSHFPSRISSLGCTVTSKRYLSTTNPRSKDYSASDLLNSDGTVRSPWEDITIPENVSLTEYLFNDFEKHRDNIALIDGVTGRKLSYNELLDSITKVASALCRLGLSKGDVITICAPNSIEWSIMYLAASAAGAIVSAVNPLYTAGELAHAVGHSKSKYVITIKELADVAKQAVTKCPEVKEIIVFTECEGCRPFSSLLADDGLAYPDNVQTDPLNDIAVLPYSSGTTGLPKGVMLTHHNLISNIEQMNVEHVMAMSEGEVMVGVLPFFHIYGQVIVLLSGLKGGVTTVTLPKFDPELYLRCVSTYKATILHVVPPIVLFFAKHPLVPKTDFSSVHSLFVGAAPCGTEMIEESLIKTNKNAMFRQGYGLTEASPLTHANPKIQSANRHNTIGPSLSNTDFKVIDIETGATLGQGEEGELCVRGPQVMKGYFKNQEATDNTLVNGYLNTGDIGYYDDKGHMVITDRLKELIKVKGFQVAPAELEALLVTHPAIQDAAVIGKPDEKAGELPRAYIVTAPNQSITSEDVHSFIKDKVAEFKRLDGGVEFRSEIPKSAAGKILRRVLKEELLSEK